MILLCQIDSAAADIAAVCCYGDVTSASTLKMLTQDIDKKCILYLLHVVTGY